MTGKTLAVRHGAARALVAGAVFFGSVVVAHAETALRVVMHSDLKITDPIWTTAYISRDYGYMVFDTLFALDAELNVRPQMVGDFAVSDDQLTYTFTLREGLKFHDGEPVKSVDAVTSLERWMQKDVMGQKLQEFTDRFDIIDEKTFELHLKEPYGLVLLSLAKPSSNVPFVMPERMAKTPVDTQIEEHIGSGPFRFETTAWEPGNKAVFTKFEDYVPRDEPSSWAAGGKVAKVDRVEWLSMPDQQTQVTALAEGEIDVLEQVPHDLLPLLDSEDDVTVWSPNPLGYQYMFRPNWLQPPFDNELVRRAAIAALNQEDFLKASIGNPDYYKVCGAMFVCDTTFATDAGSNILVTSHAEESKQLLEQAGYDGTPVTLLHSTDLAVLTNLAPVAKQLLERGGFTVDMQSMDWQTLVSRRANKGPVSEGGWSALMTAWVAADILNPISTAGVNAACDDAWFGWPCDSELQDLRDAFAREQDPEVQKSIATAVQERALEVVTHGYVGQYYVPMAYRSDKVDGLLPGPATYFWNVQIKDE